MKYLSFAITVLFLFLKISCNTIANEKQPEKISNNSKSVLLQLIDSLGSITFSVANRYDTNFSWTHYSDCGKPCDEKKYRFQPKALPIIKETGMFWEEPKDSVDQLTIIHSMYFPFRNTDTTKNLARHASIIAGLKSKSLNYQITFDTLEKIKDRYYSIIAMESNDFIQSKKVFAITTIKGNEIRFEHELITRNNDSIARNFVKKSIELIRTTQISKKQ